VFGVSLLILGWLFYVSTNNRSFVLEARERLAVYKEANPHLTQSNSNLPVRYIEKGEVVDIIGCKDIKTDIVPMISLPVQEQ
jgi:hypothetical protein